MNASSGLPPSKSPAIVDWLSNPDAYPQPTKSVQRVETHISWVFLTDDFAYKLKKTVRFDFVDFSTLDLRRRACEEEVRLNRRLAPSVYLGVVAITSDAPDSFRIDEQPLSHAAPSVVDWLVKMNRLPEDATLLARIRAGLAGSVDAQAIAGRLAEFYRGAPPLTILPTEYRAEIERHIQANRAELLKPEHGMDAATVKRVHGSQLRMLQLRPQRFDERVQAGRIVDGHGDLRPEHIYLTPEPVVIDCIEFNPEFRRLDVADELSFLATECDFAGAESLGRAIFDQTLTALSDQPPAELVSFYRSYRACVRAKVAVLRARQLSDDARSRSLAEAARHLYWADRYDNQLPRPLLVVMSGLMGSGKSTLARRLADLFGAQLLSTDEIRVELFGKSDRPAEYGRGHYRPEGRDKVYDELFRRADNFLNKGQMVIVDGAFLKAAHRDKAHRVARKQNTPWLIIHCHCPIEVARRRIESRLRSGVDSSEGRADLLQRQRQEEQVLDSSLPVAEIDTTQPLDHQVALTIAALVAALNRVDASS